MLVRGRGRKSAIEDLLLTNQEKAWEITHGLSPQSGEKKLCPGRDWDRFVRLRYEEHNDDLSRIGRSLWFGDTFVGLGAKAVREVL